VRVRFQADADFDRRIVRSVRRHEPSIDFQFASEARNGAGLRGVGDDEVIAYAAQEGRALVTHDRRTVPYHFANFILHSTSPGVFVMAQTMQLGRAVEWLITIWAASEGEEWTNRIIILH
jgi:hypothetical protein